MSKAKRKRKQPKAQAPVETAIRPTPERLALGSWTKPKGIGKHERPMHDAAHDAIGALWVAKAITDQQHDTARTIQEEWAAYVAELDISTGRSCLDIGPVGHGGGDGNPKAVQAWRDRTGRLDSRQYGALTHTVCMGNAAGNFRLLRDALDICAEGERG